MRSTATISGIVILALLGIVLCGMMPCLELLAHYSLLAGSVPMQPIVLAMASLLLLGSIIMLAIEPSIALRIPRFDWGPDPTLWRPLQLAFSDGILNTKVF